MPPRLQASGHVWADGEAGPGPQKLTDVRKCRAVAQGTMCLVVLPEQVLCSAAEEAPRESVGLLPGGWEGPWPLACPARPASGDGTQERRSQAGTALMRMPTLCPLGRPAAGQHAAGRGGH